jgi:hypothetical protein
VADGEDLVLFADEAVAVHDVDGHAVNQREDEDQDVPTQKIGTKSASDAAHGAERSIRFQRMR